jgi:hypothetical protein
MAIETLSEIPDTVIMRTSMRTEPFITLNIHFEVFCFDRLCGLVVRVPGYRSRGLGSISGATRFTEK